MSGIEEKAKRKAKPHQRSRLVVALKIFLTMSLTIIALFIWSVASGVISLAPSEINVLNSEIATTNAYIGYLIDQTNAAATQFYLATTSPTAITPTPSP